MLFVIYYDSYLYGKYHKIKYFPDEGNFFIYMKINEYDIFLLFLLYSIAYTRGSLMFDCVIY